MHMYLMLVHTRLQAWYWHDIGKAICLCACLMWRTAHSTETKEIGERAAQFRLCNLMEAVFQTFAWAGLKSGLHFAFIIRAWFVLCEKLLGSVKRAKKIQKMKMKADLNERNKELTVFTGLLLWCIIYIVSTLESVLVTISSALSCPRLLQTVVVPGLLKMEEEILDLIHDKFWSFWKTEVLSLGGFQSLCRLSREPVSESTWIQLPL